MTNPERIWARSYGPPFTPWLAGKWVNQAEWKGDFAPPEFAQYILRTREALLNDPIVQEIVREKLEEALAVCQAEVDRSQDNLDEAFRKVTFPYTTTDTGED